MNTKLDPAGVDRRIADLAARQHGSIERRQLLRLGLSASGVDNRVASGRLHRRHQGVYSVGHAVLTQKGRWMAAVLACGDGAALSHGSAGELHAVRRSDSLHIDVIVPGRRTQEHAGIAVHRPRRLEPDELVCIDGIPVTTLARTLLDLGDVLGRRQLERACDESERSARVDWQAVLVLIDRHPGKVGSRRLRRLLAEHGIGGSRERSGFERDFVDFCAAHHLPAPEVNAVICGEEVDFCWPASRVIVETDGYEFHRTRFAFERDRRRDRALVAVGWRVIRVPTLRTGRRALARDLRRLLG